jgi:hypothetical protein
MGITEKEVEKQYILFRSIQYTIGQKFKQYGISGEYDEIERLKEFQRKDLETLQSFAKLEEEKFITMYDEYGRQFSKPYEPNIEELTFHYVKYNNMDRTWEYLFSENVREDGE